MLVGNGDTMGGIVMWIVLGSLIGLVALFVVVTTILDRKKRKKIKAQETLNLAEIEEAKLEILYYVEQIVLSNEKLLKNFVPSVGKIKMSDIRNKAKEAIKKMVDSKEYKLIEYEEESKELLKVISALKSANSNTWSKMPETKWVNEEAKKLAESNLTDEYRNIVAEALKETY